MFIQLQGSGRSTKKDQYGTKQFAWVHGHCGQGLESLAKVDRARSEHAEVEVLERRPVWSISLVGASQNIYCTEQRIEQGEFIPTDLVIALEPKNFFSK